MLQPQISIKSFTTGLGISPNTIAAAHLKIRQDQEAEDNNIFTDIYDSQPDIKDLENYYIKRGGNFFIAIDEYNHKLAGFVALRNDGDGTASLKRLAVIKQYRRQGIAMALVRELVIWARQNGFTKIRLQTGVKEHARFIYERTGFNIAGTVDRKNKPHDWIMELELRHNGADERT